MRVSLLSRGISAQFLQLAALEKSSAGAVQGTGFACLLKDGESPPQVRRNLLLEVQLDMVYTIAQQQRFAAVFHDK